MTKKNKEEESMMKRGGVACPFPWRLHDMLAAVEQENLEHIVSWQPHGRAFRVDKPSEFVEKVLPRYVRNVGVGIKLNNKEHRYHPRRGCGSCWVVLTGGVSHVQYRYDV